MAAIDSHCHGGTEAPTADDIAWLYPEPEPEPVFIIKAPMHFDEPIAVLKPVRQRERSYGKRFRRSIGPN